VKITWLDIRASDAKAAILAEALRRRIDGVVSDDVADFAGLPPTMRKVLFPQGRDLPDDLGATEVVILQHGEPDQLAAACPELEFGRFIEVRDPETLAEACRSAQRSRWTLLLFRDPTTTPLEIVTAAAARATGSLITVARDVREAEIIFGALEHGSDGVMLAPTTVDDAMALKAASFVDRPELDLVELAVTATTHVGMGEHACVDTCTYLREDEGILVGSHAEGMVLCVSDTPPLPFRVNAGAIHSYTLSQHERTSCLSELRSGSRVTAVDMKGRTRRVTVGRVRIESRPLISVDAVAANGQAVNLILQDDCHVRVLGPGGVVLTGTELTPGDRILGYLPPAECYPINEKRPRSSP
jgi:3-amino-4-hydroxybenzoic acid synthase